MNIIALHHCLQVQISRFEKQMGTYLKKRVRSGEDNDLVAQVFEMARKHNIHR